MSELVEVLELAGGHGQRCQWMHSGSGCGNEATHSEMWRLDAPDRPLVFYRFCDEQRREAA